MTRIAAAVLAVLALAPRAAAADKIKEIVVEENTKTSDETVLLIADVEPGDEFSYQLLDEIRVRLVSSELFKSVEVFSEPVPGGVRITILARDKHSWIVAPTFYNQPGNRGGGVGFAEANLFGENKKLLLYGQIATADSFFIGGYVDPSIAGTRFRWQVDTFLRWEDVTEYSIPSGVTDSSIRPVRTSRMRYLNGGVKLGFSLFRAFTFDARLRGAHVKWYDATLEPGVTCADVVHPDDTSAEAMRCDDGPARRAPTPGDTGFDVSTEYILQLDRRANWYGIRTGNRYRLSYERAEPSLGSDFDYWYAGFSGFFGSRGHLFDDDNLIVKASFGIGKDMPMQHEYTSGGVDLRGFRNREFRGDFKVKGTIEYSVPLVTFWSLSWRALAFWDSAYTDFLDRDIQKDTFRRYLPDPADHFAPWRNGIGGGIRVYFRSVVVPLLGFDVGYGLPGGEIRTYFAVGLTEL
ncbi:MAG: FtsQ-type POTRA domain-containing protein [Deltaproteobacteria bacterium]|nr:MAG: FtsQ-type POTRA domain-containing protein [Deltaproteobacteria bacterium]